MENRVFSDHAPWLILVKEGSLPGFFRAPPDIPVRDSTFSTTLTKRCYQRLSSKSSRSPGFFWNGV
jgi:hypothetical protein